jgi:ethanolamine utilization protein EutQ (cupin superfamily)
LADLRQQTETNFVLAGELHVECEGRTVVVGPGDTVQVPARIVGRYWAQEHARIIAVYGPNPAAKGTEITEYWDL